MKENIDTAGNKLHNEIFQCPYCEVDSAGNHQSDCLFWINKIADESVGVLPVKEYKIKMKVVILGVEQG